MEMTGVNPSTLLEALRFAADRHRNQRRKDAGASPYINHPIDVAAVLATEAAVTDEPTLIAAVLHDTVEDTETSLEEIQKRFGAEVAQLVGEMSDDKSLPKEVRKQLQVDHAAAASLKAKRIKIADKICNVRDVGRHPPATWPLVRRREYLDWSDRVVAGCRGAEPVLGELFDRALLDARTQLGVDA
jgi:guanosine-3',5'-bis(diphosphate) 3'-pyrophosphohydrolase